MAIVNRENLFLHREAGQRCMMTTRQEKLFLLSAALIFMNIESAFTMPIMLVSVCTGRGQHGQR